jgi:hypothetical protein
VEWVEMPKWFGRRGKSAEWSCSCSITSSSARSCALREGWGVPSLPLWCTQTLFTTAAVRNKFNRRPPRARVGRER